MCITIINILDSSESLYWKNYLVLQGLMIILLDFMSWFFPSGWRLFLVNHPPCGDKLRELHYVNCSSLLSRAMLLPRFKFHIWKHVLGRCLPACLYSFSNNIFVSNYLFAQVKTYFEAKTKKMNFILGGDNFWKKSLITLNLFSHSSYSWFNWQKIQNNFSYSIPFPIQSWYKWLKWSSCCCNFYYVKTLIDIFRT